MNHPILKFALPCLLLFGFTAASAQRTVTIGSEALNEKAVLTLVTATGDQGFILPVVADRNAISPGASEKGMLVYENASSKVYLWNGSSWLDITAAGSAVSSLNDIADVNAAAPTAGQVLQFEPGTGWVAADVSLTDTDDQGLILTGDQLTIEGGTGSIDLSAYRQDISFNPATNELTISEGSTITLPSGGTDADADPTNEIQNLSLAGTTINISRGGTGVDIGPLIPTGGTDDQTAAEVNYSNTASGLTAADVQGAIDELASGSMVNTDNQELTYNSTDNTLSIDRGNSVDLSGLAGGGSADDWGAQVVAHDNSLKGDGTTGNPLGLAQQTAANGQVLKWNGTNWLPANDNEGAGGGATYTAGDGIAIDGSNVISNTGDADDNPANELQTLTFNTTSNALSLTDGNTVDLSSLAGGGTDDQILIFDATTNMLEIEDGNTVDLSTLSGGAGDDWGAQVVEHNATLAGDGTAGSPLMLAPQGATSNQVLKWNGSAWAPGADATGGGGFWLLNEEALLGPTLYYNGGNVGIGVNAPNFNKLELSIKATDANTNTGLYSENLYSGEIDAYGIQSVVAGSNSSFQTGVFSAVSGGSGEKTSYESSLTQNSNSISYGFKNSMQSNGNKESYGFHSEFSGTGTGTKYGIYSDGEDKNYFSGDLGIGTESPTAKLDVAGVIRSSELAGTGERNVVADAAGNLTIGGGGGSSLWTESGDDIYYDAGNVRIGNGDLTTIAAKLNTYLSPSEATARSGVYARNEYAGVDKVYGFRSIFTGTGTGRKYGFYSEGDDWNYISGGLSIGKNSEYGKLNVTITDAPTDNPFPYNISIKNSYSGDLQVLGFISTVDGTGTSPKTGFSSAVRNGSGAKYGYRSYILQEDISSTRVSVFGFDSYIENNSKNETVGLFLSTSGSGIGTKFGVYTTGENKNFFEGKVDIGINYLDPAKLNVTITDTPTGDISTSIKSVNSYSGDIEVIGVNSRLNGSGAGAKTNFLSDVRNGIGPKFGYRSTIENNESSPSYGFRSSTSGTGSGRDYGIYTTGEDFNYFSGNVGIRKTNPTVALDVNGDIHYSGTILDVSDKRLKENISKIDNSLSKIMSLNGYSFSMKADANKKMEYGVMAQDVQQVLPHAVSVVDEDKGYLGVAYIQLVPVLIEAMKEQQNMIQTQEAKIDNLETRLSKLEALIKD